jgi:hypothetical protein
LSTIHNERREGEKTKSREEGIPKFPPWEFVDYSLKTKDYFVTMKELN